MARDEFVDESVRQLGFALKEAPEGPTQEPPDRLDIQTRGNLAAEYYKVVTEPPRASSIPRTWPRAPRWPR
ncbi:hypothetical protein D7X74_04605 [Corallococcus sp. CA047B]|nr:hypothetical protein D7X74_04605 [Corallococcus sp. CA047B]